MNTDLEILKILRNYQKFDTRSVFDIFLVRTQMFETVHIQWLANCF